MCLATLCITKDIGKHLPVVSHRKCNLKLGKELEALLLSLLGEARPYKQHLHDRCHHRHN